MTLPGYSFYILLGITFFLAGLRPRLCNLVLLPVIFCLGNLIAYRSVPQIPPDKLYRIEGRCIEKLPNNNYILSVRHQNFYLSRYYTDTIYRPGDSLTFYSRIYPVKDLSVPGEYSYNRFLKQKKANYKLIPVSAIRLNGHSDDLHSFFDHLRNTILHKTGRIFRDSTCRTVINALCLGYKNDMDKEIRQLFITTGTVHLLSVSGLHTGAIFLLLLFIFRHTGLSGNKTEVLLLPLLWGYACLTGLSPSVVRASTILTFITLGKALNRTSHPVNSLAASAFLTLLVRPTDLYSVSFLMSYSAYGGIIIFYPFLQQLLPDLPRPLSYVYASCCLTVSAQLLTLPVSAYFFHTININSFLSNLLAVPLATLLLYCSSLCLLLPVMISSFLAFIPEWLCRTLLGFLRFFSPYSLNVKDLFPSYLQIILIYACLFSLCGWLLKKGRKSLFLLTGSLILLLFTQIFINRRLSAKQEVIIFQEYRSSAILLQDKGYYLYLHQTAGSNGKNRPYLLQNKLSPLPGTMNLIRKDYLILRPFLFTSHDTLLICSKKHPHYAPCTHLIVTDNLYPRTVFRDTTLHLPAMIITDGSNHQYTVRQWAAFCQTHGILFRNTAENGSLRLHLK